MNARRESISTVDLAWLRMQSATNPMTIVGVLTFAGRLRLTTLQQAVSERLLRMDRFRQMPVHDALGTHWEADESFDLDYHVRAAALQRGTGLGPLEALAEKLAGTPLDPRHPLWQMHLIERCGRGSALIVRFHHCYADGMALLRVLLAMTDTTPHPHESSVRTTDDGPSPLNSTSLLANVPYVGPALELVQSVGEGAIDAATAALRAFTRPEQAAGTARLVAQAATELGHIASLSEDPPTPLKADLSGHKKIACAEPLSFAEVKAIAAALGCTINDVLLACAAGALGAYLEHAGCSTAGMTIRALVPVNLRNAEEPALGNRFGLVFATLPVGEHHPLARLYAVHQDMQALKSSSQPAVALWLLAALGALPGQIEARAVDLFTRKATVVVSNVPGPRMPLYLGGVRIDRQFFWVPQAGSIGLGLSLLTYDGRIHFGVMADSSIVPDPRRIARAFVEEFERLVLYVIGGATDA